METKTIGTLGTVLLLVAVMAYLVMADTVCTGQDCSVSTSLTVGNATPVITEVQSGITITLTAESSVTANVVFNVTDGNGFADLNDTTAQCIGYKTGEANRTSTSCTAFGQSGNDAKYNCSADFQYFDAAASDWRWNCSITDNSLASAFNDTVAFTVNALNFIDENITSFTWSSTSPNTNDQEANTAINFDNGGNQDYETALVTASNATDGGSNVIPATAFALNSLTGSPAGIQMNDSTAPAVNISTFFTLPHGNLSSEDIFAYVDMPTVPSGSYSSLSSWLIDITT